MIALLSDCLLFELTNGESVPCSPEMITIELVGNANGWLDPEVLRHAAASVFHYFKKELCRESVTVGEFAGALEKVLRDLGFSIRSGEDKSDPTGIIERDLGLMAHESGGSFELLFFSRLRDELRAQLRHAPRILRFRGLRGCVKQLAGVRRWSARCEKMQDHIVEYLRQCLTAEAEPSDCALVVE